MVPVRKPGRPLSACPHPRDQSCGCSGVTAAIPRKQACHCGTDSVQQQAPQESYRPQEATPSEIPSPTRASYKVQKIVRPSSSRKQSFDQANFERMDMNNVNIVQYQQKPIDVRASASNGYTTPGTAQLHGYLPPISNLPPQYIQASMYPSPIPPTPNGVLNQLNGSNGYNNLAMARNGRNSLAESPEITSKSTADLLENATNGSHSCCTPKVESIPPVSTKEIVNKKSCCSPPIDEHVSNTVSKSEIPKAGSCCSSKPIVKGEPMSNGSTPAITQQTTYQILPPGMMSFIPGVYTQYQPQATLFEYPPTYGSFQNPLQPSAWHQSFRNNDYGPPQGQSFPHVPAPINTPLVTGTMSTVHSCTCGDTCQCIGCAAHPYNTATQEVVRSAWASMNVEQSSPDVYVNAQTSPNGNTAVQHNGDVVSSPTANTPTSNNSVNGEEQSLSAADYFFVNYPLVGLGCGGEMQSCPCGDDCQCLGCTIHRQPMMPCGGEKDTCLCGDDCSCIGCTIHNSGLAS